MTYKLNGGEGGIRTPDTLARMPHFECGAFDHSATSPAVAPSVGTIMFEGVAPGADDGRPDGAASNQPRHWSAPCERAGLLSKPGPRAQGPRDTIFISAAHSGHVKSLAVLRCDCARGNAAVPYADPRWPAALASSWRNCPSRPPRPQRISRVQGTSCRVRCRTTRRPLRGNGVSRVSRARPSAVSCGSRPPVPGRTGRAVLARPRPGVAQAA